MECKKCNFTNYPLFMKPKYHPPCAFTAYIYHHRFPNKMQNVSKFPWVGFRYHKLRYTFTGHGSWQNFDGWGELVETKSSISNEGKRGGKTRIVGGLNQNGQNKNFASQREHATPRLPTPMPFRLFWDPKRLDKFTITFLNLSIWARLCVRATLLSRDERLLVICRPSCYTVLVRFLHVSERQQ